MIRNKLAICFLGSILSGSALAAVSPQDAACLGKDLTPTGAEMAGNADQAPILTIANSNWKQDKIEDMLGPKYLDPESIRWEKHRVWVVEANLNGKPIPGKYRNGVTEDDKYIHTRRYGADGHSLNTLSCT